MYEFVNENDPIERGRRELAERIASAIERGGLTWAAEWKGCWTPTNAATGRAYRGVNRLILAAANDALGLEDTRWCTFRQARAQGWHVRKGEHALATVEFWSRFVDTRPWGGSATVRYEEAVRAAREGSLDPEALRHSFVRGSAHKVFNGTQVEGLEPFDPSAHAPAAPDVERVADELIASSRCPVDECRSDEAFYSPGADRIVLPTRGQFSSMDAFCRTLLHEMCHSTMGELGRPVPAGRDGYAREELVAELGSVFAAADAGLDVDAIAHARMGTSFLDQHAAYIQFWAADLRTDPDALSQCVRGATRAADFVGSRREEPLEREGPAPDRGSLRDGRPLAARASDARGVSGRDVAPVRGREER